MHAVTNHQSYLHKYPNTSLPNAPNYNKSSPYPITPHPSMIPQYINAKAGMASVNAQSIAKKVAQLTAGTPKDIHQKQLERKRALEVVEMLEKVAKYRQEDRQDIKNKWSNKIEEYEHSRSMDRVWAHLDFDMFYVACELLDKPEMRDLPCAVGGEGSVLCTANYAARLFGCRAAMPTFIAKKLCPQITLFKPNFDKYRKYSDIFRDVLRRFDANLQSHGLDEVYVDLTEHVRGKNADQIGQFINTIRKQICEKTGLTVSCGVGSNKLLAKMASEVNKPNGQFIVPSSGEQIVQFMSDKKIRKIHGIGPVNEYFLKGLGIETAKDILDNTDILSICFSENSCEYFIKSALGLGSIEHEFKQKQSISKSETFKPCSDGAFLEPKLMELCEQISLQLQQQGFVSLNAVLSYQLENYQRKDRTFNLDKYSYQKQFLYNATIGCLKQKIISPGRKIRLLGIKCTCLMKIDEWKRKSIQTYFSKVRERDRQVKKQGDSTTEKLKPASISKQSSIITQIKSRSQFVCPICNEQVQCMNNISAFNRHIDKCLKKAK